MVRDILADANAAAASEMLKSVQEEREALRTELAENKARAAQIDELVKFSRLMPTWRRPPRRSSLLRICARRLRRSCGRRRRRLLRSCRLRQEGESEVEMEEPVHGSKSGRSGRGEASKVQSCRRCGRRCTRERRLVRRRPPHDAWRPRRRRRRSGVLPRPRPSARRCVPRIVSGTEGGGVCCGAGAPSHGGRTTCQLPRAERQGGACKMGGVEGTGLAAFGAYEAAALEGEAQLSLRVKQMELAVQSAAAAADEAHKREQAQAGSSRICK